uniref:CSON009178 protein n=1 Tax=Culicoides sonorensis TaxID=179676 RepID=A0A336LZU8_CULSO
MNSYSLEYVKKFIVDRTNICIYSKSHDTLFQVKRDSFNARTQWQSLSTQLPDSLQWCTI